MLFNSFEFIFLFLPVTLLSYLILLRLRLIIAAKSWLLLASLFFYSWWNIKYLPLILVSILFNYTVGNILAELEKRTPRMLSKRCVFVFGITSNILLLGWFKYLNFFLDSVNGLIGCNMPLLKIILPLGISFFTITQIAFLVDAYEGLVEERNLLNYALFVTFFPHLLAGPILHHSDMMPQFEQMKNKVINWKNIYFGLVLFLLGLFKKVVIADTFSVWASAGFDTAQPLTLIPAWLSSLSYTFQLYFDFSGYSDMAVGIGWMFNINLPINFNSPYKATGIIDFWKRWHITLTNFITTYLYTPILRSFSSITFSHMLMAIFLSMLISGIWHGAGWTYIIWGGMHGLALVVNHLWKRNKLYMPSFFGWVITFSFVNITFVFFRSKTVSGAISHIKGMFGQNGIILPNAIGRLLPTHIAEQYNLHFGNWIDNIAFGTNSNQMLLCLLLAICIACYSRNTTEIIKIIRPSYLFVSLFALLAIISIACTSRTSEFIYFNF